MSDLRELYQQVILDHNKEPRNFHRLEGANRTVEGYNPLCGDKVTVYLEVADDRIGNISFQGSGCAIFKASASLMTAGVKGKTRAEAEALFHAFHKMVTGEMGAAFDAGALGKLAAFSGVREFPIRVKCATLPWHTLRAALEGSQEPVSTE
jgi:nitrogen fixation NifU-like protein